MRLQCSPSDGAALALASFHCAGRTYVVQQGGKNISMIRRALPKPTRIFHLKDPAKTLRVYSAVVLLYGTGLCGPALKGKPEHAEGVGWQRTDL